jgi:hypothetical protein
MGTLELITLLISAIAIIFVTVTAITDLVKGAPVGSTLKRWLGRVADAFFSAP